MRILVVGGGGREHALVWKLRQSPRVKKLFCAPGNAGIAGLAECVDIAAENIPGLLDFARREHIDLTVIGPEGPLTMGIADSFSEAGRPVFGPSARAAAIEGSKVLAKEIMAEYGIPTARYRSFTDPAPAADYIRETGAPCVVKADGLAAGKGVIVCSTVDEALQAVDTIMNRRAFGAAGARVVVEECLTGQEVSVLAFTDGETVAPMLPAQDHKTVFDGDRGPNTGGMGAYAPAPVCTPEIFRFAREQILIPVVRAMAAAGRPYRGVLYAGLILTADGPKVLEFNARFGDPEAQPVLMLLESDLVDIMEAVLAGRLAGMKIRWRPGAAVCVVLSAAGYPGAYRKGDQISGLEHTPPGVAVFHAGTAFQAGRVVTAGGRVLGVTAVAADIPEAIKLAYTAVEGIHFEGMHYRRDIGRKALTRG
ncbi:phosphoribosylamine--glycine ligase [Desulfotomaculum copahuensis]|uniref:Phosphoribosylamine--glycine ligase n=1 Tax=Desulfotomaculum copahuensis TaxID=1838280 RepID=A0A1B7LC49_9FIRM|nr:phosphoribosylamine--glycine ligase [Desulfotomaculum copahuensis]OAT80328.1 phosphoribosylamine--glycine ligase [Desulfotomaculum copahuensis]